MRGFDRRKRDAAALVAGAVVVGLAAGLGGFFGRSQQVLSTWALAEVHDDGSAQVTEVVDYDFARAGGRHGIFRIVPGLAEGAAITADSPDAPDDVFVSTEPGGTRIRIGNPGQTVGGRHRYRIRYPLPDVVRGDTVAWDAVGSEWEVDTASAEVHLVAPFELVDVVCAQGSAGSRDPCDDVRQVAPGHLVATVDHLDDHEGVTLTASRGPALSRSPAAPPLPVPPDHPGTGPLPPALAGLGAGLAGAVVSLWLIRRSGRERLLVGAGGPADSAFGAPDGLREIRIDPADLAEMATTDFAPPAGMTAAQGGIILAEDVRHEHRVAWLIEAAIEGSVELVPEYGSLTLVRRGPGGPWTAAILDQIFAGRNQVPLGRYDLNFSIGWGRLTMLLYGWRTSSGLWDERASQRSSQRRLDALIFNVGAVLLGLVAAVTGGALANRSGLPWLLLVAAGGVAVSAGLAPLVAAWELRVRTAAGSAAWLRVESFRRFLAGSEAYHAEEAAKRGVLREYTAWAVALGEIDRWSSAVRASTVIPPEAGTGYVWMAPVLWSSAERATVVPEVRNWDRVGSSSGSGSSSDFGGGGSDSGSGSVDSGAGGGVVAAGDRCRPRRPHDPSWARSRSRPIRPSRSQDDRASSSRCCRGT